MCVCMRFGFIHVKGIIIARDEMGDGHKKDACVSLKSCGRDMGWTVWISSLLMSLSYTLSLEYFIILSK